MSETQRCITELERLAERAVRRIVFEVNAELVKTTPVDTGWARANWIPGLVNPSSFNPKTNRPSPELIPAAAAQQAAGLASLSAFKLGGSAYISNHVPYIVKLNGGSSTQQPSGFVERALERGVRQAARSLAT